MSFIEVWAPHARTVSLLTGERKYEMTRTSQGKWRFESAVPLDGTLYSFSVDEGPLRPDPRSFSQPEGVHGPSCFVDHSRFRWTDARWQPPPLRSGVIYELHIGTFTPEGTFDSATDRLDYLAGLGITHIEVMPVAEAAGDRGWGYDGVDLYAPHHAYGGPEGLKRFVDACHKRGLAVLLDVVYNHLGPEGNYLSQFGPYFSKRYKTPWGETLNLDDEESCEVRRFLLDNALMWLRDYHLDGLRLDAVHALLDTSAVHFLEQLAREVSELEGELGRTLVLIAESDLNNPRVVQQPELGGYGLTAQWSDDFHHAMHTRLTGESEGYYSDFGTLEQVKKALEQVFVYDGLFSGYRKRRHGRPPAGVPFYRFVIGLQNHDQVGNRARGERNTLLMKTEGLLTGASLLFTSANVPMLFQGEEWGASTPFLYFTGFQDADTARSVSEGRKKEFSSFGWKPEDVPDPQDQLTFIRSKLNWAELSDEPHRTVLNWHRALIELRRTTPDLLHDKPGSAEVGHENQLTVKRGQVTVVCRLDKEQPSAEIFVEEVKVLSSHVIQEPIMPKLIAVDGFAHPEIEEAVSRK